MSSLAAIHIGCKQLGLDEDTRRDVYERVTGVRSAKAMNENQRQAVVSELRRLGFKQRSNGSRKRLEGKYAPKLQALWIAAWNLGVIRNRDDAALLKFLKRQTGLDHTRFLHYSADATKAIEALKAWLGRDAGIDWSVGDHLQPWQRSPGFKIALAQYQKLKTDKTHEELWPAFCGACREITGETVPRIDDRGWQTVMNELGERIRKAASR